MYHLNDIYEYAGIFGAVKFLSEIASIWFIMHGIFLYFRFLKSDLKVEQEISLEKIYRDYNTNETLLGANLSFITGYSLQLIYALMKHELIFIILFGFVILIFLWSTSKVLKTRRLLSCLEDKLLAIEATKKRVDELFGVNDK